MNCKRILVGELYGRLKVVEVEDRYVLCQCSCGTFKRVLKRSLISANTKSCGCLQRENAARNGARNATHYMTGSATYRTWQGAKRRCTSPVDKDYDKYGGRGIKMCDRWLNSFENFLADMGEKPAGLTLERRDVDGPYSSGNCEWATATTQTRNRRNSISVSYMGKTKLLVEWCEELGLDYYSAHRRLRREGRSPEETFKLARPISGIPVHDEQHDEVVE